MASWGEIMIFRKFKNGEEISFCNVDTPEEALELMFDPYATDHDEIMAKMVPTIYGFQAAMGRKPDGEPGDFWDIKGYANADEVMPVESREVTLPAPQLPQTIALDCGCSVQFAGAHAKITAECRYHSPLSHR